MGTFITCKRCLNTFSVLNVLCVACVLFAQFVGGVFVNLERKETNNTSEDTMQNLFVAL